MIIELRPGQVTLADRSRLFWDGHPAVLADEYSPAIHRAAGLDRQFRLKARLGLVPPPRDVTAILPALRAPPF